MLECICKINLIFVGVEMTGLKRISQDSEYLERMYEDGDSDKDMIAKYI